MHGDKIDSVTFVEQHETYVLGLKWLTNTDEFTYEVNIEQLKQYTKRTIFSNVNSQGEISCQLIASKSRVAPIKKVNIPRLELAAADLLSQLFFNVRESMELKNVQYTLWSDSTISLQWINKPLQELKLFVANRVKRICQFTESQRWEHIRTEYNPADLISRGLTTEEMLKNTLWWNGPDWLSKTEDQWPKPVDWRAIDHSIEMKTELKVLAIGIKNKPLEIFDPSQSKCLSIMEYSENLSKYMCVCKQICANL